MPAVLGLVLFLQSVASPSIRVDEQIATYRIEGATSAELWTQMHQRGPTDRVEHAHFAADTRWHVVWHYWYRKEAGSCQIDHSDVSFSSITTLPAWSDPELGSADLRQHWLVFLDHLKQHEAGHATNGMHAADAVRRMIDQAGSAADCDTLGRAINAAADAAIAQANRADIDYDANTRHGQTQGAVLR